MTEFTTTPDSNFADLGNFPFAPHYHAWQDMRMHYLDEGPENGPVVLMMHGMPTWSYLYRDIIPPLVRAGYRCIAPDHLGFGKSDKPTDIHWFTVARHTEILTSLIVALDLKNITLMCQDWGGPIGLAQAATMPERFDRLTIMNTWLHHPEYEYTPAIRNWARNWREEGLFARPRPDVGLLMTLSSGLLSREATFPALVGGTLPEWPSDAARQMHDAYMAPYNGLSDDAWNGARRFPLSIPVENYDQGNGAAQTLHYRILLSWQKPVHFIWGCADDIFSEVWGRKWAAMYPQATFDPIQDAAHFLQNTHGTEVARLLLQRIGEEA